MQAHKARRVLLFGKALDLDHIHLGSVLGVRERDLVVKVALRGEESLRLEMRVELLDDGELRAEDVIGDVSHRHVVGQPDLVPHAFELAAASDGQHSDGEGAAEAESRAPRREPELDLALQKNGRLMGASNPIFIQPSPNVCVLCTFSVLLLPGYLMSTNLLHLLTPPPPLWTS